jgi:DNA-binding sugar fermentation-stimulating protein
MSFNTHTHTQLFKFGQPFIRATVIRKPSRCSASPYLLDAQLEDGREVVVHNPALRCRGLIAVGAQCALQPSNGGNLSTHVLYLVADGDVWTCVHPAVANQVAAAILGPDLQAEVAICSSRFDFGGVIDGRQAYFEVKSAPISIDAGVASWPLGEKGRPRGEPVSARAVKQLGDLADLAAAGAACTVLYIVGRPDIHTLKIGAEDPIYRRAAEAAAAAGVATRVIVVGWTLDGSCHLVREL